MTAMTDFMMARSVVPAAKFYAVADEIALEGTEREKFAENSYKVVAKEGYEPDPHWEDLVFDFYVALSRAAKYYMDVYIPEGNETCDLGEVEGWNMARQYNEISKSDWVHRIVNVMNHYRKRNGAHPDMGDIEHRLMMEAIRKGRERNMGAHQ
mgnify:CR=1 FL=1